MSTPYQGPFLGLFAWPGLVALGSISYAAYAVHWPLLTYMLNDGWSFIDGRSCFFFLGVTWTMAGIIEKYYERPCRYVISTWKWLKDPK